jgi:hypothetical protein
MNSYETRLSRMTPAELEAEARAKFRMRASFGGRSTAALCQFVWWAMADRGLGQRYMEIQAEEQQAERARHAGELARARGRVV